jgi:phosphohistidine phosphatase SixA
LHFGTCILIASRSAWFRPTRRIRMITTRSIRSFVTPLAVLILAALALALQAPEPGGTPPARPEGRILLVTRHCEKDPAGDARDPGLSEAGRKRAAALQRLLAPQGVDTAFASEYKRAQETAASACSPKKDGKVRAPRAVPAADANQLFAAIDALPAGQTALVVGHSNTVPSILAHYGVTLSGPDGKPLAMMPDEEFGTLFVVTLPPTGSGAAASVLKLHYGD